MTSLPWRKRPPSSRVARRRSHQTRHLSLRHLAAPYRVLSRRPCRHSSLTALRRRAAQAVDGVMLMIRAENVGARPSVPRALCYSMANGF
eukprot:scaffold60015_cov63-Phaeocystis_antarctica.AAC.3